MVLESNGCGVTECYVLCVMCCARVPSLSEDALAAVTVPSFLKAGLSPLTCSKGVTKVLKRCYKGVIKVL